MSKVFIVNHAGHDYSAAEKWGTLVAMTSGHVGQGSLDRMIYDATRLSDSKPDDWLLPSGLLVLNVIASAYWLRKHGELRLLIRDRKYRTYREMIITSSHLDYLIRTVVNDAETGVQESHSEDSEE